MFSDRNLSADRTVSCSLCHQPGFSFAEGRILSAGVGGRTEVRKTPSLLDLPAYRSFFWDGRAPSLQDQIRGPFLSRVELGFDSEDEVLHRVKQNPSYVRAFQRLYHVGASDISFEHVARALVAFERAIPSRPLRIDRFLGGDFTALSFQARQGMEIFKGKGRCSVCHVITERTAPLTDNQYHASSLDARLSVRQLHDLTAVVSGLDERERFRRISSDPQVSELGRFVVTLQPADIGKFRTPSLRNAAGAYHSYMHDGSISSLKDAIDQEVDFRSRELGYPPKLSRTERDEIRIFLEEVSQALVTARSQIDGDAR